MVESSTVGLKKLGSIVIGLLKHTKQDLVFHWTLF